MAALRTALLSVHVAAGVSGLVLGIYAFSPTAHRLVRWAYAASLIVLTVFLTAIVAVDWARLVSPVGEIFVGLIALAIFIVARVTLALRVVERRPPDWERKYVNHIYFTYISLWEAFFIVGLIDLAAPAWVIAGVAAGVLLLGAILVNNYRRRIRQLA